MAENLEQFLKNSCLTEGTAAVPDAVLVKVVVHPLHEAEQVSPAVVLHGQVEVGAVLEGVVQLGQPRRGVPNAMENLTNCYITYIVHTWP